MNATVYPVNQCRKTAAIIAAMKDFQAAAMRPDADVQKLYRQLMRTIAELRAKNA